jgi:hypothetical protein
MHWKGTSTIDLKGRLIEMSEGQKARGRRKERFLINMKEEDMMLPNSDHSAILTLDSLILLLSSHLLKSHTQCICPCRCKGKGRSRDQECLST